MRWGFAHLAPLEINQEQIKMTEGHGGKRAGAGRKAGSVTKRTREVADKAASDGLTPLEYMLTVLRDDSQEQDKRMWAAEKAAPYIHPRLAAVEHTGKDGGDIGIKFTTIYETK